MKYWVTRDWRGGPREVECEAGSTPGYVYSIDRAKVQYVIGRTAFLTRTEAAHRCRVQRDRKAESLRKSLAAVESLKFDDL